MSQWVVDALESELARMHFYDSPKELESDMDLEEILELSQFAEWLEGQLIDNPGEPVELDPQLADWLFQELTGGNDGEVQ